MFVKGPKTIFGLLFKIFRNDIFSQTFFHKSTKVKLYQLYTKDVFNIYLKLTKEITNYTD